MKFKKTIFLLAFFMPLICYPASSNTVEWNSFNSINKISEGYLKTVETGWANNLASSEAYSLNNNFCLNIDLTQVGWESNLTFRVGMDAGGVEDIAQAAFLMEFTEFNLYIDDGDQGLNFSLSESSQLRLEYHSGTLKLFDESLVLLYSENIASWGGTTKIYLSIYNDEAFVPVAFSFCQSSVSTGGANPPAALFECSNLANEKYVRQEIYSPDDELLSDAVEIRNNFGQTLQTQSREFAQNKVLAKALVQDRYGRPALETFQAPLTGTDFCYDQNFITAPTAGLLEGSIEDIYDYNFFDLKDSDNPQLGEENNPYSVSPYSTLGAYYSGSSTPHFSNTTYPYARVHYTDDLLQEQISVSGTDETFKAGGGHQAYNFLTVAGSELQYVYGVLGSYMTDGAGNQINNWNLNLFKSIQLDANGNTLISYTNSDDQVVATCYSGNGGQCLAQESSVPLKEGVQQAIHIPDGKNGKLKINYPDPGGWYQNYTTNDVYCVDCFDIQIYDILKQKTLEQGTDFTIDFNSTVDNRIYDITFYGNYVNGEQLLGISYNLTERAYDVFFEFVQYHWINLDPEIQYELEYHDWTLNFYDTRGNLTKKVQPEGVNCDYNATNSFYKRGSKHMVAVNRTSSSVLYSIKINALPNNTNELKMGLYPNGVYPYKPEYIIGDAVNSWYEEPELTGPGGEGGGGSGGESEPASVEHAMPTMHHLLNNEEEMSEELSQYLSFGKNGGDNPKSPFIGIPDQPPPTEYMDKLLDHMRYEFQIKISGVTPVGNEVVLETYDCRIDVYDYTYVTQVMDDGQTYPSWEYYLTSKYVVKMRKSGSGYSLNSDGLFPNGPVQNSLYSLLRDDYTLSGSELTNYKNIVVRAGNTYKFEKPRQSCETCAGTIYASGAYETNPPMPAMEFFNQFNFIGDVSYEFSSTPDDIEHKTLQEEYTYDLKNQLIQSDLPDAGVAQMVYSTDGKLKFTQNAQQALDDEFAYVIYDHSRRPLEKGVYRNNPAQYPPGATLVNVDFSLEAPAPGGNTNVHDLKDLKDGINDDNCFERQYFQYDTKANDLPTSVIADFKQQYLRGRVSKSWNDYAITWYSYTHDGNIEWQITETTDLGIKTLRYHYDKIGKLIAVDYNELETDNDFYIKYNFDANQRLTSVYASDDPVLRFKPIVQYEYDLLGNLVRKEMGNGLQGVDISYTASGAVKALNNGHQPDKDRGGDGLDISSTFFKDLYAETLSYYDGDFKQEESWLQTDDHTANRYDGLVKGVTWSHSDDVGLPHDAGDRPSYQLSYDYRGQMATADFGNTTAGSLNATAGTSGAAPVFTSAANQNFRVQSTYDRNGNIETLLRRAYGTANLMDNLDYQYAVDGNGDLNSNELLYVDDASTSNSWANEITDQANGNYTYDALGRLVKDTDRDVYLTYNSMGLVSRVQNAAQTLNRQVNIYNEKGQAVTQKYYNGSGVLQKTVYRVYDASGRPLAEYEEGTTAPELKETFVHGIERVATVQHGGSALEHQYEIKDHIGNVRAVFKAEEQSIVHSQLVNTLDGWRLRGNTTASYTSGDGYLKLQGSGISGGTGIFDVFTVVPGRRYTIKVQLNDIEATDFRIAVMSQANPGVGLVYEDFENPGWYELPFYNDASTSLAVHFFIPGDNAVNNPYIVLSEAALSEDELQVLSYTDYYPFGSPMPGRRYQSSGLDAEHGYSGDYSRENADLQWNEFQYRNYDARLGRWLSPDPARQYASPYVGMGNNPISVYDPTGLYGYYNNQGDYKWFDDMTDAEFVADGTTWTLVSEHIGVFEQIVSEKGSMAEEWYYDSFEDYKPDVKSLIGYENDAISALVAINDALVAPQAFGAHSQGMNPKEYHAVLDLVNTHEQIFDERAAAFNKLLAEGSVKLTPPALASGRVESVPIFFDLLSGGFYQVKKGVPFLLNSSSKAPRQVTPGIINMSGQYIDDLGRVQPWNAYYDEFGRLVERTDWNAANKVHNIDAVHHHVYEYLPKGQVRSIDHIPGVGPNTNW